MTNLQQLNKSINNYERKKELQRRKYQEELRRQRTKELREAFEQIKKKNLDDEVMIELHNVNINFLELIHKNKVKNIDSNKVFNQVIDAHLKKKYKTAEEVKVGQN